MPLKVNLKPQSSAVLSEKLEQALSLLEGKEIDGAIRFFGEILSSVLMENASPLPISKHDFGSLLENWCKALLLKSDELAVNEREPLVVKALNYGYECLVNQPDRVSAYVTYAFCFVKYTRLAEPAENYRKAVENEKERKLGKEILNAGMQVVENLKKGLLVKEMSSKDKFEIHKSIHKCLQCMFHNLVELMEGEDEENEDEDEDLGMMGNRMFSTQHFLRFGGGREIIERKKKEFLEKFNSSKNTELQSKMYTLVIQLLDFRPLVWRRFKVPGSITLASLQDRVISPIMGWCRNYHAYYFRKAPFQPKKMLTESVPEPQFVFGPIKSMAVDIAHQHHHGVHIVDDSKVELYQVLEKKGDHMQFLYDLGDNWRHRIYVEHIEDGDDKQAITIEDGECCGPPEDCGSVIDYVHAIQAYLYGPVCNDNPLFTKNKCSYDELMRKLTTASNFKGRTKPFNPLHFSLAETKRHLQNGLRSDISELDRSNFQHFFFESGKSTEGKFKETKILEKKPDKSCVICQSTANLKQCSSCRSVYYCCREHQVKDWPNHKKICGKEK